jgi:D-alanyl-D-alanine carboxypeptidase/D-alanyl-D-alanine-endopeptidase (penicillin-binding protein 4)
LVTDKNTVLDTTTAIYHIDTNSVFKKSFTGFALFDPEKDVFLDSAFYNMYFTPASNTKILTCYAALKTLGDSLVGIQYIIQGDSLIFWGTGDPSLLNADLDDNSRIIDFLKNRKEKLFYAHQSVGPRLGSGWAWDDFNYAYMCERNDLPIYANVTYFKFKRGEKRPNGIPAYFNQFLIEENKKVTSDIYRDEHQNIFRFENKNANKTRRRPIPYIVSPPLTRDLLANAIGKPVSAFPYSNKFPKREDVKTVYSIDIDRVLAELMQPSDNFIAEQLLLNMSFIRYQKFDIKRLIRDLKKEIYKETPDALVWIDGSGISRYNLFTPRSLVYLLDNMRDEFGEERLFKIFAAGGQSGTIRRWYKSDTNTPYIYAKTGTLSNKHCLSGYLKTKSGKTLIFSFMHNNYTTGSAPLKVEMTKVLEFIRDKY